MISSGPVPWNETPAREFPAKRWLRQRYGFTVPPLAFVWRIRHTASASAAQQRPFPALVWLEEQQRLYPPSLQ